eukprot:m.37185 g.37185  ORF g.37185 m.37185 type:complete len:398 (-) comp11516_c0_seq1:152-1345(-)
MCSRLEDLRRSWPPHACTVCVKLRLLRLCTDMHADASLVCGQTQGTKARCTEHGACKDDGRCNRPGGPHKAARAEAGIGDGGAALQRADVLAAIRVPQQHLSVLRGRAQNSAVALHIQRRDGLAVPDERLLPRRLQVARADKVSVLTAALQRQLVDGAIRCTDIQALLGRVHADGRELAREEHRGQHAARGKLVDLARAVAGHGGDSAAASAKPTIDVCDGQRMVGPHKLRLRVTVCVHQTAQRPHPHGGVLACRDQGAAVAGEHQRSDTAVMCATHNLQQRARGNMPDVDLARVTPAKAEDAVRCAGDAGQRLRHRDLHQRSFRAPRPHVQGRAASLQRKDVCLRHSEAVRRADTAAERANLQICCRIPDVDARVLVLVACMSHCGQHHGARRKHD